MKKLLLGTTALATAALLSAGAANAADDGLKFTVSGFYTGVLLAGDDNVAANRGISLDTWNSEIHLGAEATAANGLTYGFKVELEGYSTGDQIDESYLWLSGAFGKLIVGNDDSVAEKMGYVSPAPDAYGILSVNSPNYGFNGATATTINAIGGDASKLIYISPSFGGFQLGLSYSPDSCEDNVGARACSIGGFESDANSTTTAGPDGILGTADDVSTLAFGQQFAAALSFAREFGKVSVGLSATYTWNEAESGSAINYEDVTTWGVGGNLGFGVGAGTVTVGGSYLAMNDYTGIKGDDYSAYDAGVAYAQGPFTVGVQSIWADYDIANGEIWGLSVGGGYEVAPGLGVSAGYIHYDKESAVGTDADVFLLGTKLSF